MPKVIKEAKNIELIINIKYTTTNDKLIQHFCFNLSNKKYTNYLFDVRYQFKRKIEALIKQFLLKDFIRRIDGTDEVVLEYKLQEAPMPVLRKIICVVPPYCGCSFCDRAKEENDFLYCSEKKKHYAKPGIKRCPIFRSKDEILT